MTRPALVGPSPTRAGSGHSTGPYRPKCDPPQTPLLFDLQCLFVQEVVINGQKLKPNRRAYFECSFPGCTAGLKAQIYEEINADMKAGLRWQPGRSSSNYSPTIGVVQVTKSLNK